jgi:hypothetical protein
MRRAEQGYSLDGTSAALEADRSRGEPIYEERSRRKQREEEGSKCRRPTEDEGREKQMERGRRGKVGAANIGRGV